MKVRSANLPRVRVPSLRAMLAAVTGEVERLPPRKPVGAEIIDWGDPSPSPLPPDVVAATPGAKPARRKKRR